MVNRDLSRHLTEKLWLYGTLLRTQLKSYGCIELDLGLNRNYGSAVAQAVSSWFPTPAARVRVRAGMWGSWWTKQHWGRLSPSNSVYPANHNSTNFSIIIITRSWHNRPIRWPQCPVDPIGPHPPPPTVPIKKILTEIMVNIELDLQLNWKVMVIQNLGLHWKTCGYI
jgi:hypothetical protein